MLFVGSECLHVMPYFNAVPCNMPGTDIGSLTGPLGVAYFFVPQLAAELRGVRLA